jgi:hypothetical protein
MTLRKEHGRNWKKKRKIGTQRNKTKDAEQGIRTLGY